MLALFSRGEKLQVREGSVSFLRAVTLRQSALRAAGNHKAPGPSLDAVLPLHFLLTAKAVSAKPDSD